MTESMLATLPIIAVVLFIITGLAQALAGRPVMARGGWIVAGLLSLGFFAFSLLVVSIGGSTGFWSEHIRNAWGNQIWLDLLLGIGIAFVLLVPRARAAGMHPLPWFICIACTGSIGLLAMVARCLFLEQRLFLERRAA